jgi:ribosome-associated translation inhibitor RaiA
LLHIVFHAHHADVTDAIQQRAEQAVRKLAGRLRGTTDASIRFAEDGAVRRVELVLRAARRAPLVAEGVGPRYEVALASALDRLGAHVAHVRAERERRRRAAEGLRLGAAAGTEDDVEGTEAEADLTDLLRDEPVAPRRAAGA